MLFMGRSLRSRLDLLKPDIRKHVQDEQCSPSQLQRKLRTFDVGQRVLARDYRSPNQKWQSGEILSQTGPLSYTVSVGPNMVWRRHVDQLLDASAGQITAQQKLLDVSAGDVTALQEGSDTPQDSEDAPMPPDNAAVNDDTQIPATVNPTLPSVTDSESSVRRYPERKRTPPQRLDL
ncbi:hypothetical protein AAFF_G00223420 [Aldrovandia affinis]|uniref:Uncharacterized protein n=1 Tax=Aldrovandia affinis TaxID=143900 RepID=A0AAD7TAT6_9TELE|nr:hypothetical protein AAFF_G00223420 [Aldrovandia affinis]